MTDVLKKEEDSIQEEDNNIQVAKSTGGYHAQTGDKLDRSPVKYEVVRMLLDEMSYSEISRTLKATFGMECTDSTVAAFKKTFYPLYKNLVEKWDMSRHQSIVARVTEEMKHTSKKRVQEVHELDKLLIIIDERIKKLRNDSEKQSAAYEGILNNYIKSKAILLQRVSEITGSTGVEEKMKEMVQRTALAAQKTLHPYVMSDSKDEAFRLFELELEDLLASIESGLVLTE